MSECDGENNKTMRVLLKVIFSLSICCLGLISKAQTNDTQINIHAKKASLKQIFNEISSQSGLLFVYNPQEINDEIKIDIQSKNHSVSQLLNQIGNLLGFDCIYIEKQIIIKPKADAKKETDQFQLKKNHTVSGFIRDSLTKEALIGASVSVNGKNIGSITNQFGYYTLPLKSSTEVLIFSHLGYKREFINVDLKEDITIDIDLKQEESYLGEISVVESQTQSGNKDDLLRNSDLSVKDFGRYSGLILGGDLVGVLATDYGITRQSDGSAFFSVRGGYKDQNLIMIDEAPIYHPSHLFGLYSAVSPISINSLNVYKSDFPIKYGGRLSSITDIKTKDGSSGKLLWTGEITPFTTSQLIEVPIFNNKISLVCSLRASHLGFAEKLIDLEGDNNFYDLHAKLTIKITPKDRLYLSIFRGKDYYTDLKTSGSYGVTWQNLAATVRQYRIFTPRFFMNNTLYMGRYDYNLYTSEDKEKYWTTRICNFNYKTDYVYTINASQNLRFGAEYGYHFFIPACLYNNGEKSNQGVNSGNADNIIFYIGGESNLTNNLSLKYGVRANIWDNYGPAENFKYDEINMKWDTVKQQGRFNTFLYFEPRISILYRLKDNAFVKASLERNVQYLHLLSNSISPFTTLDLWLPSGNYIKPQSCISGCLSIEYKFGGIKYTNGIFYKSYENLTEYKQHAYMLLNKNIENEFYIGNGYSGGIELAAEKNINKIRFKTTYTYSQSRRKTEQISKETYIADNDIPHSFNLMAEYKINDRLCIKADWQYNNGAVYTKPSGFYEYQNYKIPYYKTRNNSRLPAYHKLNIAAEYNFAKPISKYLNHKIIVSIYNTYNRTNYVSVSFNKIETPDGDFIVPSNFIKENSYVATGLSLPGIFPMISYEITLGTTLKKEQK